MKTTTRLFVISITLVVIIMGWFTGSLANQKVQILIGVLALLCIAVFPLTRRLDEKMEQEDRKKGSTLSFGQKDKKSGLHWGGGNIKASNAERGTRRKFLGK